MQPCFRRSRAARSIASAEFLMKVAGPHPSGGQAQTKFVKHLTGLGIPAAQRMGMSCGRFLRDYPAGVTSTNKYFFVYLNAYAAFAAKAQGALP